MFIPGASRQHSSLQVGSLQSVFLRVLCGCLGLLIHYRGHASDCFCGRERVQGRSVGRTCVWARHVLISRCHTRPRSILQASMRMRWQVNWRVSEKTGASGFQESLVDISSKTQRSTCDAMPACCNVCRSRSWLPPGWARALDHLQWRARGILEGQDVACALWNTSA